MPRCVFQKVAGALNDVGRSVKGARVCVLGLSYEENIDDDRESPSYEIIELLAEAGAQVDYCDPFFPVARAGRRHDIGLASVACTAEALAVYDALVVATPHHQFRDPDLYRGVALVIDTCNIVRPADGGPVRVVKA
jgi:UDP-N-acetyl-D-glucosamine dehydrogenase